MQPEQTANFLCSNLSRESGRYQISYCYRMWKYDQQQNNKVSASEFGFGSNFEQSWDHLGITLALFQDHFRT